MLFGSIASVEDHGYLVDVGIKSINAFLKHDAVKETAQDRNQGKSLWYNLPIRPKKLIISFSGQFFQK